MDNHESQTKLILFFKKIREYPDKNNKTKLRKPNVLKGYFVVQMKNVLLLKTLADGTHLWYGRPLFLSSKTHLYKNNYFRPNDILLDHSHIYINFLFIH
jgi:hypothetical protein